MVNCIIIIVISILNFFVCAYGTLKKKKKTESLNLHS